jgi:hypothetical protein
MQRYEALAQLIMDNGFLDVAEIGVRDGETMEFLLRNCPITHYLGVDIHISEGLQRVLDNNPKALFLQSNSDTAHLKVRDASMDLVFIDSDHEYDSVIEDIKNWTPKVRKGGIICGHDYKNPAHRGVEKAVDHFFVGRVQEIPDPAFVWWVRV